MQHRNETFTERALNGLFHFVHENRLSFLAGIISGLAAHMFAFTNKLVNGDDIRALFDRPASTVSGRWGIDIVWHIFPQQSVPWLHGIISIMLFSLAICLVLRLFAVNNKFFKVLLPAVFMSFPAMTSMYCYMFTSSSYALAFLLAVLSVCIYTGAVNVIGRFRFPLACLALVMSLGIYQAYIAVAASYFVLLMIQKLLCTEESTKAVLKFGLKCFFMLVTSLLVYFAITLVVSHISGNGLVDYAVDKEKGLLFKVALSYNGFLKTFTKGYFGYVNSKLSMVAHLLSVLSCALTIGLFIIKSKDRVRSALLFLCIFLLPLSIYCMYVIADVGIIHSLVMFAFTSVYVFATIVYECAYRVGGKLNAISREIITAALLLVALNNIYFSNKVYLSMHLKYENTYAYYTGVVTQIRMHEDYDQGLKVAIIGKEEDYYNPDELALGEFTGLSNLVNVYTRDQFIERYVGFVADYANLQEKRMLQKDERVISMPEYPYNGSIKVVDQFIVVKLD